MPCSEVQAEPCKHVNANALHWLTAVGYAGSTTRPTNL